MKILRIDDNYAAGLPDPLDQSPEKRRPYYYGFNLGRFAVLVPFRSKCHLSATSLFLPREGRPYHGLDFTKYVLIPTSCLSSVTREGYINNNAYRKLKSIENMTLKRFETAVRLYEAGV